MAFTIEQIEDKPIFVATFSEPHNSSQDSAGINEAMLPKLEEFEGTVYYIPDMRQVDVNFGDMVAGLQQAFASGVDTIYTNPRTKILTVGTQDLVRLAAEAVKTQEQYKKIPIDLFTTVEEAIAKAEKLMSQQAAS
ncbi:MAG: hypothetical protein AAFR81_04380 [Chloroflexota bacterium]